VKTQHPLARSLVTARTWPIVTDMAVLAFGLAMFFAMAKIGSYWLAKPTAAVVISHSVWALPLYAFYSIVRIGIAYLLSLVFAVAYGYIAAYNPRDSRTQLSARRDAGHDGAGSRPSTGH